MTTVEFELTEDDLVASGVLAARASPAFLRTIRLRVVLLCVVCTLLWLVFLVSAGERFWYLGWVFLVVGVPVSVFAGPSIVWSRLPVQLRRNVRSGQNAAVLGRTRLELLDDGVHRVHALGESKIAWPAVERLVSGKQLLALYISAQQAFIVPRRAFGAGASEAEFRAAAERLSGRRFEDVPY